MRHRLVLTILVAMTALGGPASAQSPSPQPAASPSPTPFPWPTLAPPADEPELVLFEPTGPAHARGRRFGVVVELWVSSPTVGQGEWVQAHMRVTNTRDDAVWGPGGCVLPTHVRVDLSDVYAPGVEWEGNAAAFKRRAERRVLSGGFDAQGWGRRSTGGVASAALALVDCGPTGGDVARLGPGQVFDVAYAWYPMDTFHHDGRWVRPLPPGTVTVTAAYDFISHGARPGDNSKTEPVAATTTLELTGDDPGIPSPLELLDAALADPTFAAWVAADPTRQGWTGTHVSGWPGPGYPPQPRFAGLSGRAPNGVVEVALIRDLPKFADSMAMALLDPWTGEVLGVAVQCGNDACPADWPYDPDQPEASAAPSVGTSVAPVGNLTGDGCAPSTAAEIAALGLSPEFRRFPGISSTLLNDPRPGPHQISERRARALGLGLTLPALPGGLAVHRIDAQRPIHAVRYFLTTGPLDRKATYPLVLAGGGAVLRVTHNEPGVDVTERLLDRLEKLGLADRAGIVNVAGHDALLGQGDQRGALRPYRITWSDDRHIYDLDTAFDRGEAVVDLARTIGCAQADAP